LGRIVAIGGGEIGRPGYPVETLEIDRRIVELTGKARPRALLIPTASGDSGLYWTTFQEHFGTRLGCATSVLWLLGRRAATLQEVADRIGSADFVYVGGGNTLRMLRVWRSRGVDVALARAQDAGTVLSGLSAGAICWFRYGLSDSRRFSTPGAGLIRIHGLDMVHATACPHYDVEADRKPGLASIMQRTPGIALALGNCCAIEIVDGRYRVTASRDGASAYRFVRERGGIREHHLPDGACGSLAQLLAR
jgi:dipeptidase E